MAFTDDLACEHCATSLQYGLRILDPSTGRNVYLYRCPGCTKYNWYDSPPATSLVQGVQAQSELHQQQQQIQPDQKKEDE
jgi:hypothetical protein